jgi:ubiquinone/menaquinone biosynthesis C-methylase UbiE
MRICLRKANPKSLVKLSTQSNVNPTISFFSQPVLLYGLKLILMIAAVSGRRREWQWLATTLNPFYEGNNLQAMINDDRFIDGTQHNWYFGADDTGDIMNVNNLDSLLKACVERGLDEVQLVC